MSKRLKPKKDASIEPKLIILLIWSQALAFYPWSTDPTKIKWMSGAIIVGWLTTGLLYRHQLSTIFTTVFKNKIQLICSLFLIFCISTLLWALNRYPAPYEIYRILPGLCLLILNPFWIKVQANRATYFRHFSWSSLPVIFYAMIQVLNLDPIRWGKSFGEGVFSTFAHPNMLGPFLIISMCAIMHELISAKKKESQVFWSVILFAAGISFIRTYNKGAFMSLGFGIFAYFILSPKRKFRTIAWLTAFLCILTVTMLHFHHSKPVTDLIESNNFRIFTWKYSMEAYSKLNAKNQIFGSGLGNYSIVFDLYRNPEYLRLFKHADNLIHAHCEYIQMLIEIGAVGLILFFLIIVILIIETAAQFKKQKIDSITRFSAVIIVAFLFHNFVSVDLRWFSSWTYLFIFISISLPFQTPDEKGLGGRNAANWIGCGLLIIGWIAGVKLIFNDMTSDFYHFKGQSAFSLKNFTAADTFLTLSLRYNAYNLSAIYDLAFVYSNLSQFEKSIDHYETILHFHPYYQKTHRNNAICYNRLALLKRDPLLLNQAIMHMNKEISHNADEENILYLAQLFDSVSDEFNAAASYRLYIEGVVDQFARISYAEKSRKNQPIPLIVPRHFEQYDAGLAEAFRKLKELDPSNLSIFVEKLRKKNLAGNQAFSKIEPYIRASE